MIWTTEFWKDTLERCLYTAAESLLGVMSASNIVTNYTDWKLVALTTLAATAVTFLKCIVVGLQKDDGKTSD